MSSSHENLSLSEKFEMIPNENNEIFHAFYLSTVITSSNFAKSHHISKNDEIILSKTACDFFNNNFSFKLRH